MGGGEGRLRIFPFIIAFPQRANRRRAGDVFTAGRPRSASFVLDFLIPVAAFATGAIPVLLAASIAGPASFGAKPVRPPRRGGVPPAALMCGAWPLTIGLVVLVAAGTWIGGA